MVTGTAAKQRDAIITKKAIVRALSTDSNFIRSWQKHDTWTGPHVAYHKEGIIPEKREVKTDVLMIKEKMVIDGTSGLLYRVSKLKQKSQECEYQLCVPSLMKGEILNLFHDNEVFGGHMSVGKGFYKISKNFYRPGVHSDLVEHIKKCVVCQKRRIPNHPTIPELRPIRVQRVFQVIGVDHCPSRGSRQITIFTTSAFSWSI